MQPERKTKNIRKNYVSKTGIKLELPNTADRRERARQSAVNTRIRRKAYIEQLEQKIAQLTQQTNQRQEGKGSLFNLMENFLLDRKYQFDMLENAHQAGDERKINVVTNSLRFKYGISGQGRHAAINKLCEMLIDLLLPMHMRYLFWVASENQDLFVNERSNHDMYSYDFSDSQMNCLQQFGLDENQIQKIQAMQEKIVHQRRQYDNLIVQIYKLKDQIAKEGQQCQEIVDSIWQCLKPKQAAELLIQLDKTRFEQLKAKKVYPECILKSLEIKAKQEHRQEVSYYEMKLENKQWEELQNGQMFANYFN